MTLICFVDIETTGLERYDLILEVGMVICEVDQGAYSPLYSGSWLFRLPVEARKTMKVVDVVLKMHQDNNLWGECSTSPDAFSSYGFMQEAIVGWMKEHLGDEKPYMAGSGVHFDREVLKRYMPRIVEMFHYRNLDSSTLRTVYRNATGQEPPINFNKGTHRALDDCFASISDVNFYSGLIKGAVIRAE